jgi:hypothetical protein
LGFCLALKYWFFPLIITLFIGVNVSSALLLSLFISSEFLVTLMTSLISGVSFLFVFVTVTWHYFPNVSARFWAKFLLLALVLFSFYASLSLAFGEPLIRAMGFELTPVPVGSTISSSEYATLSFFTYGSSSITNGLVSVAFAYFLQKYVVRGIFIVFKHLQPQEKIFLEAGMEEESSLRVVMLWLLLLPFPIQNILSPSPVGVSALGTSLYLVSTLALFAMWGLGLAAFVGVSKNRIFRLYVTARETLLWFLAIQWLSVIVYSALAPPLFVGAAEKFVLLIVRVLFAFTPPALMTAYLYKRILEPSSKSRIIDYLKKKEKLEMARIIVKVEQPL